MPLLVLKLIVTPILVGGSALVARRWGPSVGGWLIALPLVSGPILVFVALEQGTRFAGATAIGSLGGLAAGALFCLGYARAARGRGPITSVAVGSAVFAGGGIALQPVLGSSVWTVALIVLVAVGMVTRLIPAVRIAAPPPTYPRWDLPARMVVATALVVGITTSAPLLGAHWSGLLATFPVYLSVLAAFTHRQAGQGAAIDVLRGLLAGMYGTVGFYVVMLVTLEPLGLWVALAVAIATALAIQALTLRRILRAARLESA